MKQRLNALLLNSIGIMVAAVIMAAPVPAWSDETEASAVVSSDAMISPAPEHAAAEGGHSEGKSLGFPQLDTSTYAPQLFWLFVSFVVLYTLMSKIALPRVAEVLDMRQTQRSGNLDRAASLQDEAEKIKTAYEASLAKSHEAAASAIKSAEEDIADKIAEESAKFADHARKRILSAEQTILKAKQDAMTSLADISAEIAADIVNKITGTQLTKADAKKSVQTEMQKG